MNDYDTQTDVRLNISIYTEMDNALYAQPIELEQASQRIRQLVTNKGFGIVIHRIKRRAEKDSLLFISSVYVSIPNSQTSLETAQKDACDRFNQAFSDSELTYQLFKSTPMIASQLTEKSDDNE